MFKLLYKLNPYLLGSPLAAMQRSCPLGKWIGVTAFSFFLLTAISGWHGDMFPIRWPFYKFDNNYRGFYSSKGKVTNQELSSYLALTQNFGDIWSSLATLSFSNKLSYVRTRYYDELPRHKICSFYCQYTFKETVSFRLPLLMHTYKIKE